MNHQHDIFRLTLAELERLKAESEKKGKPEPPAARILRESLAKDEQQAQEREEIRMSHDDKISGALKLTTEIIDELYRLRPLAGQFNELATEAYRVIHNVAIPQNT